MLTETVTKSVAETVAVPKSSSAVASLTWQTFTATQYDEAMSFWRQLEARTPQTPVACSATWTECWLQEYGALAPWQIVVARTGSTVRGICLLTTGVGQTEGPLSVRTRHLGTAGDPPIGSVCVEYNGLFVDPAYRSEFIAGIVGILNQDRRWEQLRFDGFSTDELASLLPHFPNAQIRNRESKYFDFSIARAHNGDVLSQLGRSTRSNLKRRLKQYGELTCEWAESADHAADIFDELVTLHQTRWQASGQPGAFASERFRNFQMTASLKLFIEGKAALFRVRQQQETVGCLLLLNDRNRLLDYLSGFASFEEKPSPGLVSHYLCMVEAARRGFDAYDFLVGDKRHKDNLSNQSTQLHWATIARPSLKQTAIQFLRSCKQKIQNLRVPAADPAVSE